ncbi:phenylcoumaran benzylic ether reductase Pyrc5-like [Triticum dicoccoides]|uniref:phenylcoumaran benzylic ether reductase Pyrc5-like n=1 Tax=Triticum dicoccoides TaxID=85692 RepID=UPI0018915FD9|nr:phenylcoumaran benzylic ether reductase Pyrc5-like [Triticum dicoccoides]
MASVAGEGRSRVLVIGGTGYIGRFIVAASAREGHPTAVLVRDAAPADPAKAAVLQGFRDAGVTIVKGDMYDHESLVTAIKSADVVISAVGYQQLPDQTLIISAIKEVGHVKRFFPSEYGNDVDRNHAVEPAKTVFGGKARIRRAIEAEGIPYTYVSSNFFAGRFLRSLAQIGVTEPPTEKVLIMGDGNVKGIFAAEEDVGTYTIKAVDDPRTLNKILYLRPPSNTLSHNELVSLWEKKLGKTLERVYLPEDELLKKIRESSAPLNVALAISHSVWLKGDHTNFEIDPSFGVEATQLYPDVPYITVDEYLNRFL